MGGTTGVNAACDARWISQEEGDAAWECQIGTDTQSCATLREGSDEYRVCVTTPDLSVDPESTGLVQVEKFEHLDPSHRLLRWSVIETLYPAAGNAATWQRHTWPQAEKRLSVDVTRPNGWPHIGMSVPKMQDGKIVGTHSFDASFDPLPPQEFVDIL